MVSVTAASTCSEKHVGVSHLPWPYIYFFAAEKQLQAGKKQTTLWCVADRPTCQNILDEADICG